MEALIINSWIGKKVRIKRDYIKKHNNGDDYVNTPNGLNGVVDNPTNAIFTVKMDVYGVDMFNHRRDGLIVGDVKPTHLLIIEIVEGSNTIGYPYLWDAEYFEEYNKQQN
jgi:hypothetical protein